MDPNGTAATGLGFFLLSSRHLQFHRYRVIQLLFLATARPEAPLTARPRASSKHAVSVLEEQRIITCAHMPRTSSSSESDSFRLRGYSTAPHRTAQHASGITSHGHTSRAFLPFFLACVVGGSRPLLFSPTSTRCVDCPFARDHDFSFRTG